MKNNFLWAVSTLALMTSACDRIPLLNKEASSKSDAGIEVQSSQYTCPMHPHYISTDRDGTCPICGMDLVAVVAKRDGGVSVSPEMIQTMGVRIVPAEVNVFSRSLRAYGTVETDERLENVSVSRLEGWIEDLRVRAEGDTVRPGALLYKVYSPELIAAQKDYLNSLTVGNDNRIAAVKQRLRSIGMQMIAIDQLTQTKQVIEHVPVYAESGGIVANLQVREGDYVKPGTSILRLQSYSGVWIIARVPEQDLSLIDTGMSVRLDFPSAPDAPAEGRIKYIYPTIDSKTRTGEVRIEVDNAAGYLRPGAYANILFDLGGEPRLSVPTEAILRDSRGSHVILALGEGRFAGRAIQTGISANGLTEITSGLQAGEPIVASGQFMLDSEVNLREGFSKLQAPLAMSAGPDTPLSQLPIDAETLAQIDHFTDMALYFHEALTDGYKIDPYFVDPAINIGETLKVRFANTRLVPILEDAQKVLRSAQEARDQEALKAELLRLMKVLEPWLLEGAPIHYRDAELFIYREDETDRIWLQSKGDIKNPFGSAQATHIDWPDPMAGFSDSLEERTTKNPHIGHN